MFGTLLESTRSRQSKAGSTFMSVVAHAALVAGAAAATTSAGRPGGTPRPPEVIDVIYTVPERRDDVAPAARGRVTLPDDESPARRVPRGIDQPRLMIPPVGMPRELPSIDAGAGWPVIGTNSVPGREDGPITGSYLGSGASPGGVLTADGVERTVALRHAAEPAYPAALRQLGVEGAVRVLFVVDTLGRVELASVDVRASAHEAFSEAVRAVLPRLRFAPARVAGRPVRQLVEMPFVFSLTR